jgi:eukaryotic-like serine/threonine-protein kinase
MDAEKRPDSWIGRAVGESDRYKITRSLNAGGMGHVYVAIDTKLNNQQVAIKVLRDSLAGVGEMHERFKREVDLCAALSSPNVVRINDRGTTSEGFPFYVMEFLQGQSLGQLLHERKQLPVAEALEIILQICEGLQIAHAGVMVDGEHCQVVHRDLKPDNIFLQSIGRRWLVKILDFGIAKKVRDKTSEQASNATNFFLGTWRYSAPEQIEVHPAVDQRADIYSLGMIMYQMLSGRDPFGFWQQESNGTLTTWWRAHTAQPPEPLRQQPGCAEVPQAFEDIILKCLEKLPDDRFASVADLKQALEPILFYSNSRTRGDATAAMPEPAEEEPSEPSTKLKGKESNSVSATGSQPTSAAFSAKPEPRPPKTNTVFAAGNTPSAIGHVEAAASYPSAIGVSPDAPGTDISRSRPARSGRGVMLALLGLLLVGGAGAGTGYYVYMAPQWKLTELKSFLNGGNYPKCMDESQAIAVDSNIYAESQEILNRCRLLQAVQWERESKVQEAIALVKQIPSTSSQYEEAQKYLKLWEQI